MANKDTYIQRMHSQLEELKCGIDMLEDKTHVAEVTAMTALQSELHALRLQWQKAGTMLDQVKLASEDAWEDLQAASERAIHSLADSFQDFKSRN